MMYVRGEGVPLDYFAASQWLRQAAAQGMPRAQFNIGVMHAGGLGFPQDHAEAAVWYRRAAEQGHGSAQYNLAQMYFDGNSVERDLVLAHVWANLAAANGHADGGTLSDAVAGQLSEGDVLLAQEIARRCLQQGYRDCAR